MNFKMAVAEHKSKPEAMKLALSKLICNVRVYVVTTKKKKKKRKYKGMIQSKKFEIFQDGEEERPH